MTYILIILLSPLFSQHWQNATSSPIEARSTEVAEISATDTNFSSLKRKKISTPISKSKLMQFLREGHISLFGKEPSKERLASAWAQVSLENGRGSKLYNYNFGNIGASKKEPHFFIGSHRFRSNSSPEEGAILYWKTINKMCSSVLPIFDSGDPTKAAYKLRRCKYYQADKEKYARGMRKLYWEALETF